MAESSYDYGSNSSVLLYEKWTTCCATNYSYVTCNGR